MKIEDAIKEKIKDLAKTTNQSLTSLCLNSNITPSTIFDFIYGKTKIPNIKTIFKLCRANNLTLADFFSSEEFDNLEDK